MLKKGIEIAGNVLFWALTSWVITQLFSIERQEIEIINEVERTTLIRNPLLVNILLFGQLFRAVFFYLHLWLIRQLSRQQLTITLFMVTSLSGLLVLIASEYGLILVVFNLKILQGFLPTMAGFYVFYYAVSGMYGFVKSWMQQVVERQELRRAKKEAELNLLRAQLNPHFLFNTLNNLLAMAEAKGNRELSDSLSRLSELLRYSLYDMQYPQISLQKEVAFIRNLIELYLIRYDDSDDIEVSMRVEGELEGHTIEPGLLLPLVENAFKHGVVPEQRSVLLFRLDVQTAGTLTFEAKNTKHEVAKDLPTASGIGLQNIRQRLQHVYPHRHHLRISETQENFTIQLRIYNHETSMT